MNLRVKDAAMLMGKSEQFIRIGLQMKVLPFGYAILSSGGKYKYYISSELFEKYMDIRVKDADINKSKNKYKYKNKNNSTGIVDLKNKLISNLSKNVGELDKFRCEIELLKLIFEYELGNKKKQEIKCHN